MRTLTALTITTFLALAACGDDDSSSAPAETSGPTSDEPVASDSSPPMTDAAVETDAPGATTEETAGTDGPLLVGDDPTERELTPDERMALANELLEAVSVADLDALATKYGVAVTVEEAGKTLMFYSSEEDVERVCAMTTDDLAESLRSGDLELNDEWSDAIAEFIHTAPQNYCG